MDVVATAIDDVKLVKPRVFGDERGFFLETYQTERYAESAGISLPFVQDNHSRSAKGVLRGMHFQKSKPQGKLVRAVRGAVFDVAVDIRPGSPTFGTWVSERLSEDNKHQLWIPPGFAHGFLVLTDSADVEYKCTEYYDPADEGTLSWNDPSVGIDWPLTGEPTLSEKDRAGGLLAGIFE